MIKIMAYHKDPEEIQLLGKWVTAYFQKVRHTYQFVAYTKWENAAKHLREEGAKDDIVFLDCTDLPKAASLTKQLRSRNTAASWVYVGADLQGLCALLLMRPSAYLPGLSDGKQTAAVLQRLELYHQEMQKRNDFTFKLDGEYVRVPFTRISYFESNGKKVILHLDNSSQTYYFPAKLDDIEEKLPGFFLRCHQSYLVNMHMIRNLNKKGPSFVLYSMEEVGISRRSAAAAKEAYEAFLEANQEKPLVLSGR